MRRPFGQIESLDGASKVCPVHVLFRQRKQGQTTNGNEDRPKPWLEWANPRFKCRVDSHHCSMKNCSSYHHLPQEIRQNNHRTQSPNCPRRIFDIHGVRRCIHMRERRPDNMFEPRPNIQPIKGTQGYQRPECRRSELWSRRATLPQTKTKVKSNKHGEREHRIVRRKERRLGWCACLLIGFKSRDARAFALRSCAV